MRLHQLMLKFDRSSAIIVYNAVSVDNIAGRLIVYPSSAFWAELFALRAKRGERMKWMGLINGLDLNRIFSQEPQLDFFINVSVVAAQLRNESFPHTIIVCNYPRLTKAIEQLLVQKISEKDLFWCTSLGWTAVDVCAKISQLKQNSVLFLRNGTAIKQLPQNAIDIFRKTIERNCLEFKIGKGAAATTCSLDIPPFSCVLFFEDIGQIPAGLRSSFENVIVVPSASKYDLCAIEAEASAIEMGLKFSDEAIDVIVQSSQGDPRKAGKLAQWVRDYMLVNNVSYAVIPENFVQQVIALRC